MIKEKIRDVKRFNEILRILVENQAGYIIEKAGLETHLPYTKRLRIKRHDKPGPERLRETLEELGTVYIKFGQILAQRPDLIPERYTEELAKLQDEVPAFEWSKAEEIIDQSVGLEHFKEIEEEPIAAASIAQVHRGKLENGEDVVLKVRRPGIQEMVEKDLDLLQTVANEIEKHSDRAKTAGAVEFVEEFSRWTREELDLEQEALNAEVFKENMTGIENVKVPKVYPEHSSEKVLVMEYVDGVKCTEMEEVKSLELKKETLAKTMIDAGLKQSIIDGFFHADPHPSNFLITKGNQVTYLDFGMMGKVSSRKGEKLGLMMLYMIREDVEGILDCLEDLGKKTGEYDRVAVAEEVERKMMLLKNSDIKHHSFTEEFFDLFVKISDHGLIMPTNLSLMGKSLVTSEGICIEMYPEFRIKDEYEDMVMEKLREENSPKKIGEDLGIDLLKNKEMISKLPSKINEKLEEQQEINIENHVESTTRKVELSLIILITGMLGFMGLYLTEQMLPLIAAMILLGTYFFKIQLE